MNYTLRFLRWPCYLWVAAAATSFRWSGLTFVAGLVMVLTPARARELGKSYLLRRFTGVPSARSTPVVLMERVTDVMALALIAVAGLTWFAPGTVTGIGFLVDGP